jgi:hypothetical protein
MIRDVPFDNAWGAFTRIAARRKPFGESVNQSELTGRLAPLRY